MFIPNKCRHIIGWFLLIGALLLILYQLLPQVKAEELAHAQLAPKQVNDDLKVLVVFSSPTGEVNEHVRLLDMILSHFTTNISFKHSAQVLPEDFDAVTHLIYYGQIEEILPPSLLTLIDSFTGIIVTLGYNVEQLDHHFSFLEPISKELITELSLVGDRDKTVSFPSSNLVLHVGLSPDAEVLIEGSYTNGQVYPFFVKHKHHYYYASYDIRQPKSVFLAEALHHVFPEEESHVHPGYIRLEDIHPLVDPNHMQQIADILKEKNIPYMLAVIPVYTNPETGKQYHFSDSPKLLKVLKYMQENGGSIVLHGYTHQFRTSETGEGFEFWDVEHNMPIYHNQHEPVVVKTRTDFASEEQYAEYLAGQKAFEREYIQERVTRGIQELANYGLYPLAFEAPHYTMSQQGYQVISEHFSTYVGQLQLSDEDWVIMTTAPNITQPSFLHGMMLLPETLGYVQPDDPQAIAAMMDRAHTYQVVRDGMVAGFYHPYLGVDRFIELLAELEKIPNISWIDLKQLENNVQVESVSISSKDGQLIVEVDQGKLLMSSVDFLSYHALNITDKVIWGIAVIGALAVVLFMSNIIIMQVRNNRIGRDQLG